MDRTKLEGLVERAYTGVAEWAEVRLRVLRMHTGEPSYGSGRHAREIGKLARGIGSKK